MNTKRKTKLGFVSGFDVIDPALGEYAKTRQPSSKLAQANENLKTPGFQKLLKEFEEEMKTKKSI